jgi:hypothetical protein
MRCLYVMQHCCDALSVIHFEQSILKPKLSINEESGRFQILQAQSSLQDDETIALHKKSWRKHSSLYSTYPLDLELLQLFDDQTDLSTNHRTQAMSTYASLAHRYFGQTLDSRYVCSSFFSSLSHTSLLSPPVDSTR